MGDRTLVCRIEADRERSAEPDGCESDVGGADVAADCPIDPGDVDQAVEHVLCGGASIGPVSRVEQGVQDVDHTEAGVDGVVHVAAQGLATGDRLDEQSFTLVDRSIEHVEYHRTEKCLPVGEVSVQGGDPDTRPLGNCVSGWLAADIEDQLDGCVEEPSAVPSSVGPHRNVLRIVCGGTHDPEYIPPLLSRGFARTEEDLRNHEPSDATKSIADAIAESSDTDYFPVTLESCDHVEGPFFHGTKTAFDIGDRLVPGHLSNYHEGRNSNHIYFAALLEPAAWAAELATALAGTEDRGRIYVVEPTGPFEDDPNVTHKRFPGNVTRSYRTRHPMLVIEEVRTWRGHDPEELQRMLDNIARLREQGLDVIED